MRAHSHRGLRGHTQRTPTISHAVILLTTISLTLAILPYSTAAGATDLAGPPTGQRVYIFISASLPPATLHAIAAEAAPLRVPLVLRGFVGTSLQETLEQIKPLTDIGAGLEIDPLLFEAYGVQAVPAVVKTCGARGEGPFVLIYGLAPTAALERLERQLPCNASPSSP